MSLLRQLLRNGEVLPVPAGTARPTGRNAQLTAGNTQPTARNSDRRPGAEFSDPDIATTEALLRLADGERPLVLAVDDAHLMDEASLDAVVHLLGRSRFRPVLVVCTTSGHPGSGHSASHAELIRRPHRRVRLGPLSERGIGELIAAQSTAPRPAVVGRAFHRATAGNPLLAHALLDDSTRFGRDMDRPIAGTAYRQAVLSVVRRGEPRHLRVIRALAALGAPASAGVLGELADTTPAGVEEAVEALNSAGLLDGHAFRLPAAATAVLEDMDPTARATLHARTADLLYRSGAPAGDMARHLRAADRVPQPWGPGVLRAAAEQALAADDVELCSSYLNLMLRDCTDPQERNALSAALARAEWRVNPAAASAHLEPLRRPALDGELSMRDTATVLRHMLWQGDTELAAETVATLVPAHSPATRRSWSRSSSYGSGSTASRCPPGVRGAPVGTCAGGLRPTGTAGSPRRWRSWSAGSRRTTPPQPWPRPCRAANSTTSTWNWWRWRSSRSPTPTVPRSPPRRATRCWSPRSSAGRPRGRRCSAAYARRSRCSAET